MSWKTSSTILAKLHDFDERTAWSSLAEHFRLPIQRSARSQGLSEPDADDVAQATLATFAKVYRAGDYDPGQGRLSHWLYGIARVEVKRVKRARFYRRERAEADLVGTPTDVGLELADEGFAEHWDAEWERAILERSLERVREEVREQTYRIFWMVVLDERRPSAVAQELDVPLSVVYNATSRVRGILRELIAQCDDV